RLRIDRADARQHEPARGSRSGRLRARQLSAGAPVVRQPFAVAMQLKEETMYDLIIIGGGAAGLSAATYALGKQLDVLLIYDDIGGKAGTRQRLSGQVEEEYLAGAEAVLLFERRITAQAGRTLRDRVTDVTKMHGVFHITTQHHGV